MSDSTSLGYMDHAEWSRGLVVPIYGYATIQ